MFGITISLAPNATLQDARRAAFVLATPWQWIRGSARQELKDALLKVFHAQDVVLMNSGRMALHAALQSLNIPRGSEVLLQAYTCVSVPGPVLWNDLRPIYVDIDETTLTMSSGDLEKKMSPRSRVLIIQHTFGFPAAMQELLEIARAHNLIVIEDCAHGMSSSVGSQRIGTFGDAAIVSFGRDKALSSVYGGALIVHHPETFPGLKTIREKFSEAARTWVVQQLLHALLMPTVVRPLYFVFGVGKVLLVLLQHPGIFSRALSWEERQGQQPPFGLSVLPNGLAILALDQWHRLEQMNAHRRALAEIYDVSLSPSILRQKKREQSEVVPLRYTIFTSQAKQLRQAARNMRMLLGEWYEHAVDPAGTNLAAIGYPVGSCPVAERMATMSVNLPVNPTVTTAEAEKVSLFVNRFLESVGKEHV